MWTGERQETPDIADAIAMSDLCKERRARALGSRFRRVTAISSYHNASVYQYECVDGVMMRFVDGQLYAKTDRWVVGWIDGRWAHKP